MERHTLNKDERLCSKKQIDALFASGISFVVYPYRVVYQCGIVAPSEAGAALFVSVSKKRFKRAVKRNLLRRRSKEAYRLHKQPLQELCHKHNLQLSMAILYLDKEEQPYELLERKMVELLKRLTAQLTPTEPTPEVER